MNEGNGKMQDPDAPGGDDGHLSDEEIQRALEGFEKEFAEQEGDAEGAGEGTRQEDADRKQVPGVDSLDGVDFDQELAGLTGERAKCAAIITRLASAELLAAFCQISDISAACLDAREGAVAVLRNVEGDGPEAAVRDLTTVVSGLSAILAVNRADKLEVTLWIDGRSGQSYAPPILFATTAGFVEDLMIGTTDVDGLKTQGMKVYDSGDYDRKSAMGVIASHTRLGRGGGQGRGRVG